MSIKCKHCGNEEFYGNETIGYEVEFNEETKEVLFHKSFFNETEILCKKCDTQVTFEKDSGLEDFQFIFL